MQFDHDFLQLGGGSSSGPLSSMNSPSSATPKAPSSAAPAPVSEAWGFGAVEMAPLAPPPPGSKKDDGCEEQEDEGRALKKRRVGSAGSQKSGTTKATTNNATPRSTKKGENSSNAGTPHQAKLARANIRGRPTRDLLALSKSFVFHADVRCHSSCLVMCCLLKVQIMAGPCRMSSEQVTAHTRISMAPSPKHTSAGCSGWWTTLAQPSRKQMIHRR